MDDAFDYRPPRDFNVVTSHWKMVENYVGGIILSLLW